MAAAAISASKHLHGLLTLYRSYGFLGIYSGLTVGSINELLEEQEKKRLLRCQEEEEEESVPKYAGGGRIATRGTHVQSVAMSMLSQMLFPSQGGSQNVKPGQSRRAQDGWTHGRGCSGSFDYGRTGFSSERLSGMNVLSEGIASKNTAGATAITDTTGERVATILAELAHCVHEGFFAGPPSSCLTRTHRLSHTKSHALTHTHLLTTYSPTHQSHRNPPTHAPCQSLTVQNPTHSHSHTYTLTLTLSHLLSHTYTLTLTLSHLLSHTYSLTLTLSHLLSHTYTLTLTLSHLHSHTYSLTLALSHSHSHSHSHTHTLTLTLSHLHSHTYTLTLAPSHLHSHTYTLTFTLSHSHTLTFTRQE